MVAPMSETRYWPREVRVRTPAKINLHLGVGPLRDDGYHELTTVFHSISLYDELVAYRDSALSLLIDGEGSDTLPTDGENLVTQAVHLIAKRLGREPQVRLRLHKAIPIAGGLAGGSADAAAALVACDTLWGGGLSRDELRELAGELGSDVPFALTGGTALGTGRGEILHPVLSRGFWHWVIAFASGGLSTPKVYEHLDELRAAGEAEPTGDPDQLLVALRGGDAQGLAATLANDMQVAAISLRPELARTLHAGLEEGALAGIVAGSGPTCLFLASDAEHATKISARLAGRDVCRTVRVASGPVPGARVV